MKTITLTWLKKHNACKEAVAAFKKSGKIDLFEILNTLIESNEREKLEWANWLIVRVMNKKQKVQYAIFAAELVIDIFEKEYPKDNRPRKAIEAAKKYLKRQSIKNRNAAHAAHAAAFAAYADADAAAYAAAYAAFAAFAAYAAYATAYATFAVAHAAHAVADAADYNKTLTKVLKNGIKLIKRKKYKSLKPAE